jgi:CHAT domain-containing protein
MIRRRERRGGETSLVIGSPDALTPSIATEVADVASLLPNARVLTDSTATRALLVEELPQARYVHIAAHGEFRPLSPSHSSLSVGGEALTAEELERLRLNADLVTLSACETGLTATSGSDEILGLTQALLQAGAASMLVSMWKVEDRSTALFMRSFYSRLAKGGRRDEILQETMIEHRFSFDHPYFWAPFIIVGDPAPA